MSIRILLSTVIALSCFSDTAYAEEGIDLGKYMAINTSTKFEDNVWKLRINNYMTIGHLKAINDFIPWCTYETRKKENINHIPCEIIAQEGEAAESRAIASIKATKVVIDALDKEPRTEENTEHLVVLKDQLSQLDKLPTPLHSIIDAMKNKQ